MSHSLSPVSVRDVGSIVEAAPVEISKKAKIVLWVLILLGIGAFVCGVTGDDPRLGWIAFHVNFTFWLLIAAAGAGFSAVFHICNAQWARPVQRLFESCIAFFPLAFVLLGVLYFGHGHIFVWEHEQIAGRGSWLKSEFVFLRDFIGLGVLFYLSRKVINCGLRRDLLAIRGGLTGVDKEKIKRWMDPRYDSYVAAQSKDAVEQEIGLATCRRGRFSPVVVMAYAVVMTMLAFDLIMSVDPHWFSTLFGAFVFMSGVYLAFAWVSILIGFIREGHPLFKAKIERRTLHDVGKLLFGFGIFWAYLFWSHYLPIWYGNMPEETGWLIVRLREAPWHGFAWLIFGASFIVPFLLGLSRDVKQMPTLLFATGIIIACGIWLQQYLLLVPTLYPDTIPIGWKDMLVTAGFGAAFFLSQISFLAKVPLMPFGDFYQKCPCSEGVCAVEQGA